MKDCENLTQKELQPCLMRLRTIIKSTAKELEAQQCAFVGLAVADQKRVAGSPLCVSYFGMRILTATTGKNGLSMCSSFLREQRITGPIA